MHEAMLWKKSERANVANAVDCFLCARRCLILDGKRGFCWVRENRGGRLYALTYGKCCSWVVDPVEKKPFYHFMPGTSCLSFATVGCNMRCLHCFAPDTMVMTEKGPVPIGEIFESGAQERMEGTTELRHASDIRVIAKDGSLRKVVRASRHHYCGEVLEIKPLFGPSVTCTPDHQIFVAEESGAPSKKRAGDLKANEFVMLPVPAGGKNRLIIDARYLLEKFAGKRLKHARKFGEAELAEIGRMREGGKTSQEIGRHFRSNPAYIRTLVSWMNRGKMPEDLHSHGNALIERAGRLRFGSGKVSIPCYILFDERFAKLLGYYCAEGSVGENKKRPNSYTLRFSFGAHERHYVKETRALLKDVFGVSAGMSAEGTTLHVVVGAAAVALVFRELCGAKAKTKRTPPQLYASPDSVIDAFLEGYVNGDGWRGPELTSTNTVSRGLAFGVYSLLLKRWRLPRMYLWEPPEQKTLQGRMVNQSQLYYVKYKETNLAEVLSPEKEGRTYSLAVPITKIMRRPYDGFVYNLEVEGEHSYTANFIAVGNCQNWSISQPAEIFGDDISPEEMVSNALATKSQGIAYTYTEPTIFFEYAYDTARLAKPKGLYNVFVTNGYQTPETIERMAEVIDASRIDLKAFTDKFYKEICGNALLEPVLGAIKLLHKRMHIELITLLIPTLNDSPDELRALSKWVADLDKNIPLHFTAYYPANKMSLPPTPPATLTRARKIAMDEGVHFVYTGNVPGDPGESTYCYNCGKIIIRRFGFSVLENIARGGRCPFCGTGANIVERLGAKQE